MSICAWSNCIENLLKTYNLRDFVRLGVILIVFQHRILWIQWDKSVPEVTFLCVLNVTRRQTYVQKNRTRIDAALAGTSGQWKVVNMSLEARFRQKNKCHLWAALTLALTNILPCGTVNVRNLNRVAGVCRTVKINCEATAHLTDPPLSSERSESGQVVSVFRGSR